MLRIVFLLSLFSLATIGQAANMVVIHSNAADFPLGKVIDAHTTLNLPANAEITLAFGDGSVKTVAGPYQGKAIDPFRGAIADDALITALSEFVRLPSERIRGAETLQNMWLVDVNSNKRYYCVNTTDNITFWRPENVRGTASQLTIKHKTSGEQIQIMWPANQPTISWPSDLRVVYGDTYTVELSTLAGHNTFKKVVLYQLPASLPSNSHKVVWMVGRGCILQANMLLANLR